MHGVFADHDLAGLGESFESGGDVDGVADGGVIEAGFRSDVADDGRNGDAGQEQLRGPVRKRHPQEFQTFVGGCRRDGCRS